MGNMSRKTTDRTKQLDHIAQQVRQLTHSPLYAYRQANDYLAVIGEGDSDAAIMFIGEAPGEAEAKTGRPFVGASGRYLNTLFESVGLRREDVYITNIVKDRPPENRDPTREEIDLYAPFLVQQIDIIQPRVIATLGRFAMEFVLTLFNATERDQKISVLHGKTLSVQAPYGPISVVPLYHPAVALYSKDRRATLERDFQALKPFV
jgi:DNA polymerase